MLKDKDMREDQDGGGGEDDDDDWIEPTKAVGNRRKVKSLQVWTVLWTHMWCKFSEHTTFASSNKVTSKLIFDHQIIFYLRIEGQEFASSQPRWQQLPGDQFNG